MATDAFISTLRNPQTALSQVSQDVRAAQFRYIEAWVDGTVLHPSLPYRKVLTSKYRVYRDIRLVWNPTPSIIKFWSGILYPGNLSADGKPFASGKPLAIPISDDAKDTLKVAIAQNWQWGNFQARKAVLGRYGSMSGSCLVEVVDAVPRRKVFLKPIRPDYVADRTLNESDDCIAYAVQLTRIDPATGKPYVYRKEVDKESIRTFRAEPGSDKFVLYPYDGVEAEIQNPYGFCPAVWIKHIEIGADDGAGALDPLLLDLLEINSIQSQIDDALQRSTHNINIQFGGSNPTPVLNNKKRESTNANDEDDDSARESVAFWYSQTAGTIVSLSGSSMNVGDARAYLADRKQDFKDRHPEIDMYNQLRRMSQVTGPAAEILLGDTTNLVREVRSNYDRGVVNAQQMAVSISAFRAKRQTNGTGGDWLLLGPLTKQHEKFTGYDMNSYERGELDHEILDRDLVPDPPPSPKERRELAEADKRLGIPLEDILVDDLGKTRREAQRIAGTADMAMEGVSATLGDAGSGGQDEEEEAAA
jgi:hypothetical protein